MNIERVELQHLQMPLKFRFETSFGSTTLKDFLLVSVYGDGEVGYGESVAMPDPFYNEETTETVWYMLEKFLIPRLLANPVETPEEVARLFAPIRRNNMAKSALEGAVWDLSCKQKGISLAKALGGSRSVIDVGISIGIEPTVEEVLEKVGQYLDEGYKKIKVKIKPGFDVQLIRGIRERFGDQVPLMADANSAYTLDQIDIMKELDQYGLIMIEQPLAHDDIIDHAQLQAVLSTPICLDESIHTVEDARKAIELKSCGIINIKIGRVGGLTEAKRIHDLCQAQNIPVWCGGMVESGVGRAHNVAITSLQNFTIPGDTAAASRYWDEDIVEPGIELIAPGQLAVPDGPGIGYKLNQQAVGKYVLRSANFRP
ncbi:MULTISPECIES: o-succinylbenzoate synthase [Brevibacillus]|uniref:o-succinylbenzoate synthase n=1 Tax=Brevibacillus TaxID=55080 RepID=UPI00203E3262|nr:MULTISPECIES: o-succinylbenzoate synthase [Brevibacillus]MCM3081073.1 o-succinylbenzoate synthase [Brevibacillus invocatus]MCM3431364.1 o-succinylbenzoate synthase [Brevibacillus invocatus]MDH4618749.1 o-succinylbenzoate synthase [Brevibacillus sp. AY1]